MTFYVQGLNGHEVMPLMRLFDRRLVEKIDGVASAPHIDTKIHHDDNPHKNKQPGLAVQSYQQIDQLTQDGPVLLASQVMISPVLTLKSYDSIADAIKLFQMHQFRHIPVVAENGVIEGIISDRDILHHLSGISEDYKYRKIPAKINEQISGLMKPSVLTATVDTDVRYIARLFVEQRIGAMPIVQDVRLTGMITRSDILTAVMRHFILELWA